MNIVCQTSPYKLYRVFTWFLFDESTYFTIIFALKHRYPDHNLENVRGHHMCVREDTELRLRKADFFSFNQLIYQYKNEVAIELPPSLFQKISQS